MTRLFGTEDRAKDIAKPGGGARPALTRGTFGTTLGRALSRTNWDGVAMSPLSRPRLRRRATLVSTVLAAAVLLLGGYAVSASLAASGATPAACGTANAALNRPATASS